MKKLISMIKLIPGSILIGGIIICLLFGFGLGIGVSSSMFTKTIKLGFEDIGELVTQTSHVTVIGDNKKNITLYNNINIPFTQSRQIFSYDYDVDASVDFAKISYDVNKSNKEITIKLPHSKVYKVTEDVNSLKVYLDEDGLFTRISLEDQNELEKKLVDQAKTDSVANGLLTKADDNAKKLISGFIKSNKEYNNYKVSYKYID